MSDPLDQMRHRLGLRRLGYADVVLEQPAVRWTPAGAEPREETVAEEIPVALVYNGVPHVVMMATPRDLEDFAVGFTLTEELAASAADITAVEVQRYGLGIEVHLTVSAASETTVATRHRPLTGRTGCGICGASTVEEVLKTLHPVPAGAPFDPAVVYRAVEALATRQPLNDRVGAAHAAGWATRDGEIVLVREDIGRHNALDKLVGAFARGGERPEGFVVVTSRASFEMVQKASVLGAPVLAAISGPTGLAVRVAEQAGMALVGFTRNGRATVYTHPERLGLGG
ncbi:MAG TPA: formate dehydrogenase accessory sulfurtransferase FdhD [Gemmatimonadales bacterium]|nr:formate dehydrogenase accessory sulfurtransferase FdhD [Gemmatimonadales bacterium]